MPLKRTVSLEVKEKENTLKGTGNTIMEGLSDKHLLLFKRKIGQ